MPWSMKSRSDWVRRVLRKPWPMKKGWNGVQGLCADRGTAQGYFEIRQAYRPGMDKMARELASMGLSVRVLSGDHAGEEKALRDLFGDKVQMQFDASPQDKLEVIRNLQREGRKVLMIGDGLNDAGALRRRYRHCRKRPCGPVHTGQRCDPRWRLFIQAQPLLYDTPGRAGRSSPLVLSFLSCIISSDFHSLYRGFYHPSWPPFLCRPAVSASSYWSVCWVPGWQG